MARDKFTKLTQYCCCLVPYKVDEPLILLDWEQIYGAMLGNLGLSIPIDLPGRPAPPNAESRSIFMAEARCTGSAGECRRTFGRWRGEECERLDGGGPGARMMKSRQPFGISVWVAPLMAMAVRREP